MRPRAPSPLSLLLLLLLLPFARAFQLPSLQTPVSGASAASAHPLVAFYGGIDATGPVADLVLYNMNTGVVNRSLPFAAAGEHSMAGMIASTGESFFLLVVASDPQLPSPATGYSTFSVDPSTLSLGQQSFTTFTTPRIGVACAGSDFDTTFPLSGFIVMAGGYDKNVNASLGDTIIWTLGGPAPGPPLATPRAYAKAAAFGNCFVVSGGRVPEVGALSNIVDLFCYHTSSWNPLPVVENGVPNMWRHAIGIAPIVGRTLRLFIAGGEVEGGPLPGRRMSNAVYTVDWDYRLTATTGVLPWNASLSVARADLAGGCGRLSCVFIGGTTDGTTASAAIDVISVTAPELARSYTLYTPVVNAAATVVTETGIAVFGGGNTPAGPTAEVWALGALFRGPFRTMQVPRRNFAACANSDQYILLGGGCTTIGSCTATSSVELYDYFNAAWSTAANLTIPRGQLAAASYGNWSVFAGGVDDTQAFSTIDLYQGVNKVATNLTLSVARANLAAAAVGTFVIFAGGVSFDGATDYGTVDVLEFVSASQPPVSQGATSLATPRELAAAAPIEFEKSVYICGGLSLGPGPLSDCEVFNALTMRVSPFARSLTVGRYASAAIAPFEDSMVIVGGVLATGGLTPEVSVLRSGAVYRSQTYFGGGAGYSAAGSMPALLTAFVAGGGTPITARSTDINVVQGGHWSLHHLAQARSYAAAAAAGTVLVVAGGQSDPGSLAVLAEVFDVGRLPFPTPTPTPPPGCPGSAPVAGAVCVNGVWTVAGSGPVINITVTGNQTVVVAGDVILLPGTITVITPSPGGPVPISVTGSILLDGVLTVVLSGAAVDQQRIPLIAVGEGGAVNGTFSEVVIQSTQHGCNKVSGDLVPEGGGGFSVLVTVRSRRCGLSPGAIAGIVVGCVIAAAIVVAIVLLLWRRTSPQHPLFNMRSDKDSGWR